MVGIDNPDNAAADLARPSTQTFSNSLAETLTETEQAFQLGFVAMSNEIIAAIRIVSYVVILIIMAVMANTMAMSARERIAEYATLKALGFGPGFIAMLIFGESFAICALGGALGVAADCACRRHVQGTGGGIFPIFQVSPLTLAAADGLHDADRRCCRHRAGHPRRAHPHRGGAARHWLMMTRVHLKNNKKCEKTNPNRQD